MLKLEFIAQMQDLLRKDYIKYENSLKGPPAKGIVLNVNLLNADKIKCLLNVKLTSLNYFFAGYKLTEDIKLGNTWWHHAGLIYLQEPSSMAAANCFSDLKNKKILDLCACPGGKTFNLSLLSGGGQIVSNEIFASRAKILFSNVERLALDNVVVTNNSAEELASMLPEYFDAILVDAPCSGEGMFRKDPQTQNEWEETSPQKCKDRQIKILKDAIKMLKVGGELVYSTCTFNLKEDEEVVAFLLGNGFEILKINEAINCISKDGIIIDNMPTNYARRFYPFDNIGEGQFVCLLKKVQNCSENYEKTAQKCKNSDNVCQQLSKSEEKTVREFLDSNLKTDCKFNLLKYNNNIFVCNNELYKCNLKFVAPGVCLGQIVKDRLEPHHQFFKVYGKLFKTIIELNNIDTEKYFGGEELSFNNNNKCFVAVTHNNVVLGGAKLTGGKLKNYYPKGLRAKIEKVNN